MSPNTAYELLRAETPGRIEEIRTLFKEYAGSLDFGLCFQDFEGELARLPADYAPPSGRLLLALSEQDPAGCVALRPISPGICEMKRLYVRPAHRGTGLGRRLCERIISEARGLGYAFMRLDTVASSMPTAVALYQKLGFREIPPYRRNPVPGALYMELELGSLLDAARAEAGPRNTNRAGGWNGDSQRQPGPRGREMR